MGKQPTYFYTSVGDQKVPVTQSQESEGAVGLQPRLFTQYLRFPSWRIPARMFFAFAAILLGGLSSLSAYTLISRSGRLPQIQAMWHGSTVQAGSQPQPGKQGLQVDVQVADARVEIVKRFLTRYDSPLDPPEHYAKEMVAASDRYGLDFRLMPAIMMQESNLCKNADPALHNCFGFGIHERGKLGFDTYEASFDRVARELKERYVDTGLTTPEQIMRKYTPGSDGSWATSVNQWIAEMEYNSRQKGIENEADADLTVYTAQ